MLPLAISKALMSFIFVSIFMLWLFHNCFNVVIVLRPLANFSLISLTSAASSVIKDPRYRNVSTCSNLIPLISMLHVFFFCVITFVLFICIFINRREQIQTEEEELESEDQGSGPVQQRHISRMG